MYRIPNELDLTPVIGEFTTQLRVGQFDLQFSLGIVDFAITSQVNLFRKDKLIGHWEEGKWPEPAFYEIMNSEVTRCQIANDRLIIITFANEIEMHLKDDSDQYECMQINIKGNPTTWVI
jgi:hypothetical protein